MQVLEIPLKARDWERVRKDEQWQAALELTRPSQALRDHFRKLFQIIRQQKDWLAVTGAEQRSMPGAPNPQVLAIFTDSMTHPSDLDFLWKGCCCLWSPTHADLAVKSDHLCRMSACRSTSAESSAIAKGPCCLVMAVHFHMFCDLSSAADKIFQWRSFESLATTVMSPFWPEWQLYHK